MIAVMHAKAAIGAAEVAIISKMHWHVSVDTEWEDKTNNKHKTRHLSTSSTRGA